MIKITVKLENGDKSYSCYVDRVQRFKDKIYAWDKNKNIEKEIIAETMNHEENTYQRSVIYNGVNIKEPLIQCLNIPDDIQNKNNAWTLEIEPLN